MTVRTQRKLIIVHHRLMVHACKTLKKLSKKSYEVLNNGQEKFNKPRKQAKKNCLQ